VSNERKEEMAVMFQAITDEVEALVAELYLANKTA